MFNIKSNLLIRLFFLVVGLVCVSSTFAALLPNGTTAYLDITVNHAQVSETDNNFLYQFKVPLDAKMKAACDSAKNFVVCTSTDTSKFPRVVKLYPTKDTLLLYVNAPKSTTIDRVYRLCSGKTISAVNSASAFTNDDIVNFYGFDEFANGATSADFAGGNTATINSPCTIGNSGQFGNSAMVGISNVVRTGNNAFLSGATQFTISTIVKHPNYTANQTTLTWSTYVNVNINSGYYTVYFTGGADCCFTSQPPANTFWMLTYMYNGSGATNSDKIKCYVNGNAVTLTFTGTIPASMGVVSAPVIFGRLGAVNNYVDNALICSSIKSPGSESDRYKMLFTPSTFATFGSGFSVGSGGGRKVNNLSTGLKLGL